MLQSSETNNFMEGPKCLSSKKTIIYTIYIYTFIYNSCHFVVCWLCNGPCIWGKGYNPIIRLDVNKKDSLNVDKTKHRHDLIETIKHICAYFKWLIFCSHYFDMHFQELTYLSFEWTSLRIQLTKRQHQLRPQWVIFDMLIVLCEENRPRSVWQNIDRKLTRIYIWWWLAHKSMRTSKTNQLV